MGLFSCFFVGFFSVGVSVGFSGRGQGLLGFLLSFVAFPVGSLLGSVGILLGFLLDSWVSCCLVLGFDGFSVGFY